MSVIGSASSEDFEAWLDAFRGRAFEQQIRPDVFERALKGRAPLAQVLTQIEAQPENNLSLAQYMDRVMPPERIQDARKAMHRHRGLLLELEETYRVEPQIVVAIWAIETDLGRLRGDIPTLEALATLAWKSRRSAFFEGELIAALRIIQLGHVAPDDLRGSWAGAFGHGQFMPSSWLQFAADHDGDGLANIWHDDPVDGLASIANYICKHDWKPGQPWGFPVTLPSGFDPANAGIENLKPASFWAQQGLRAPNGPLPDHYGRAALILPAGHKGPAFLVLRNFLVLMRYNSAIPYALAVACLSDRLADDNSCQVTWPSEPHLKRGEILLLQAALASKGYDTGGQDGLMGPATRRALQAWQKAEGLTADGYADLEILALLQN